MSGVHLPELVWRPSPNQSSRRGTRVDLLVLHETAGVYRGDVNWLCDPRSEASSTFVLREDGLEATQLVELERKPWTQCAFNPRAVSVELSNLTAKGYASEQQLAVAARIFAWLVHELEVPPRWSRDGRLPGVCRHLDLGAAGCGHTQCGPSRPGWHRFLAMMHAELERGHFREAWAR